MRDSIVLWIMEYGGVEDGIRRSAAGRGVAPALTGPILISGSRSWTHLRNRLDSRR
ncbi:MAG: hypothetical protein GF328_03060 [Candidatus Latescibacteria bacterium]|nr:hypothetical protein [Candidatus Latescibacterota bacterium]